MLHEFLSQYKKEIIQLCRERVAADGEAKPTSALLDEGLPLFYDELIGVLRRTTPANTTAAGRYYGKDFISQNRIRGCEAAAHGKESLRLGYTISQVVHSYGAVCQSVTEFVQTKSFKITSLEFQNLNLTLDCAIAEAVTEFEKTQNQNTNDNEIERLGFLMHEMGNSLAAASIAHSMIQKGQVGSAGNTSEVLSRSHVHMQHLIDCSLAEIRLRGHSQIKEIEINLVDLLNEVKDSSEIIKNKIKSVHLEFENIDPVIQFTADRHLVLSALSNLVKNAMKFTKKNGGVWVRGKESEGRILIEVEDECGGVPDEKMEELFKPFIQKGADKSGMGLGLSLSRRAIELNHGSLTARNIPEKGCIFTIDLPLSPKQTPLA